MPYGLDTFRDRVVEAAACDDAIAAVHEIYARLQMEISRQNPLCVASGKCCHFDEYGHRLYLTTLEMAAFVRALGDRTRDDSGPRVVDQTVEVAVPSPLPVDQHRGFPGPRTKLPIYEPTRGCRFQIDKLCSVHSIRPFGCRIFFCDPTASDWQRQQYETVHGELKQLHIAFDVEYFYVEWREALAAVFPQI